MRHIGYDTETTGLAPHHGDDMFMFSTCSYGGRANAYRLDSGPGKAVRRVINERRLLDLWKNPKRAIVAHNVKFDLTFTEKFLQKEFVGEFHCTLAMAHLLMNLHPHHRLKPLCWELARIPTDDADAVKAYKDYHSAPEHIINRYAALDAFRTMVLFRLWWPEIQKDPGTLDAYKTEMALVRPTMAIEERGMKIDPKATKVLVYQLTRDCARLERELHFRAGMTFDPSSTIQLRHVLFEKLKLPVIERTKKTKQPSTAKDCLMELRGRHKIVDLLMKYRSYKGAIPRLEGYLRHTDADDIIHPDILLTGASTGRQSSSRPNMFNVQRKEVLRNPFPVPARRLFIARPGYTNYHMDYKGEEIRLLVHYHGDEEYTRIFSEGGDPHKGTGEPFYGDKVNITKYRNAAKNGTFLIGYGGGIEKLARTLVLSYKETKAGFERYRERFPKAAAFAGQMAKQVRDTGYVITEFGRKIMINPEAIYTSAANGLIQGTGAGIIKRVQPRVHKLFQEMDNGCHSLLPIYDELFFEVPDRLSERQRKEVLVEVKRRMEDFPMFRIPLKVDCKRSKRWSEKEKINVTA